MRILVTTCVTLVALGSSCVTVRRAKAAEAMQCPESEVTDTPDERTDTEGARIMTALMLLPAAVATGDSVNTARFTGAAVKDRRTQLFSGCGMTYECSTEGCSETPLSRGTRLSQAVPALMEKSRASLGTDTTAERAGYFTWDLSSPRGPTHCRAVNTERYHCSPDLEGEPTTQVAGPKATPTAPPPPPAAEPAREPLRAK
jgi:hypothetical protein